MVVEGKKDPAYGYFAPSKGCVFGYCKLHIVVGIVAISSFTTCLFRLL
jgi:hypothetical protein